MKRFPLLLLALAFALRAEAITHFVWTNSPSETPPYTNGWNSAAHTIQAALDVATGVDEVLVTNGVYSSGGANVSIYFSTFRVALTNAVTVRSVNGPSVTTIKGQFDPSTGAAGSNAIRCAVVTANGTLVGFTLAGGATVLEPYNFLALTGGGLFLNFGTVSNCVISGNKAVNGGGGVAIYSAGLLSHSMIVSNVAYSTNVLAGSNIVSTIPEGGGLYMSGGELRNCIVTKNSTTRGGGGAYMSGGRMDSCTVSDNTCTNLSSSGRGGGVHVEFTNAIVNSIVYGNHANSYNEYDTQTNNVFSYSCSTPLPTGPGNFDADPELLGGGNFHIGADSPCINAGSNQAWMSSGVDMDDEPRIQNGRVDVGADEALDFSAVDISKPTNAVVILWSTPSNDTYRLQYKTNPITGVWSNLGAVSSAAGFVTTVDTNPFHPYRQYRLITN